MGDWTAVVGEGEDGRTVERCGLGKRNERGESLIYLCKRNAMIIENTIFQQHTKEYRPIRG